MIDVVVAFAGVTVAVVGVLPTPRSGSTEYTTLDIGASEMRARLALALHACLNQPPSPPTTTTTTTKSKSSTSGAQTVEHIYSLMKLSLRFNMTVGET